MFENNNLILIQKTLTYVKNMLCEIGLFETIAKLLILRLMMYAIFITIKGNNNTLYQFAKIIPSVFDVKQPMFC